MSPQIVERFYRAFAERDVNSLLAALDPACVGHVSAGMPFGLGGRHEGPEAMLRVWMRVFQSYDVTPVPDWVLADPAADGHGRVVVHGWYEGVERSSGASLRAEFVHVLELAGERIVGLRQVTDTASWPSPAA
jgi:2-(1,2-epoxy-1,2-dihydrophenyl)acetyl-CoA isomerase